MRATKPRWGRRGLATATLVGLSAVSLSAAARPAGPLAMRSSASEIERPRWMPAGIVPFAWLFAQDDPTAPPAPPAPPASPGAEPPAPPLPPETPAEPALSDEELAAQAIAEAEAAAGQNGEVIQVTGSAIERTETTTSAPVTVLDREELVASGHASIGDILQDLPFNSNAINTTTNNGGEGSTRVDIRGLGEARTLVLVNGRRHVVGGLGANESVDLSAIPLAVVERVEVLKDGASAVYGSDAVAGVVNIITRRGYDGAEVNLYTGTSHRGGGTTYDMNFVVGHKAPKGSVTFSAGFFDQKDIFADQRGWSSPARSIDWDCIKNGGSEDDCTYDGGSYTTPEGTIFDYVCGDGETPEANGCAATEADLICPSGICFNDDGVWRDIVDTGVRGAGGDLYNFQPTNYLLTPNRRFNVWTSGDYKLHDNVRAFFEASYVNRTSAQQLAPEPLNIIFEGIAVSADNVYNDFDRDLTDVAKRFSVPRSTSQEVDTFRIVTGFDGKLPDEALKNWKWELSYNFGQSVGVELNKGNLIRPAVAEALGPSYLDGDGVAHCGTPDAPGSEGCVPLDILSGIDSITPEMLKGLTYVGTARGYNKQHTVLAQVNGPVVKLPNNGDVVAAIGADYRREAGGQRSDPLTATGNTTGNKTEPTSGNYDVVEGFAELSIVPVSNVDWAKWLEVNLAGRVVNYSTFGSNFSWKSGLLYKSPAGIALRGTASTAFRAPNISELYSGQADSFQAATDPCDSALGEVPDDVRANCTADGVPADFANGDEQVKTRIGGNPDVGPETAMVYTAGVVYEPPFAEGLAVALDWFHISIDDSIQAAGPNVLLAQCYSEGDQDACSRITRADNGRITSLIDTETNIGNATSTGIDGTIGYTYQPAGAGRLRHELEGTYLLDYTETLGGVKRQGDGYYDLGPFPRFRANFSTMWSKEPFGAGFNLRYIRGIRECADDDCSGSNPSRRSDDQVTGDVYASYSLESPLGKGTLTAGVNNVLDSDPPFIYNGFLAASDETIYDYIGRYYYLRLTQAF